MNTNMDHTDLSSLIMQLQMDLTKSENQKKELELKNKKLELVIKEQSSKINSLTTEINQEKHKIEVLEKNNEEIKQEKKQAREDMLNSIVGVYLNLLIDKGIRKEDLKPLENMLKDPKEGEL
jgi:septal ring factor EnvC (AmiA/AmiB activator)